MLNLQISKAKIVIFGLVLLLLIPFWTFRYEDGGSVEHKALLWSVTKVHAISNQPGAFDVGWRVKVLGMVVYEETTPQVQ